MVPGERDAGAAVLPEVDTEWSVPLGQGSVVSADPRAERNSSCALAHDF